MSRDYAFDVALPPGGKIVVGGMSYEYDPETFSSLTGEDFALVRYNADGTLDTSFSGDGKATVDFQSTDSSNKTDMIRSLAVAADGRITAVGMAYGWSTSAGGGPSQSHRRR